MRTPVGGGAPVTWTYHYTYGHRLAAVENDAVSPLTASYHYDSDDRRTKKVVNGVTIRTMWSGTDELAEYDVNGDLIRRFIPDGTGTMDARLATVTSAGVVYWHHTDHQGSVIATSDSAGKTVGTATYSPHGEGAPPTQSPFGYTGRQYDPETGLYYYRARYYSPYLGQFLTRDPIGAEDDPNLYMYVGLDPANATDPAGRSCVYMGEGKGYACKVDSNSGNLSATEVNRINAAYSGAVNRLMAAPNTTVDITVGGSTMTVTARQVATGLIGADVRTGLSTVNRAATGGGTLNPGGGNSEGRPILTIMRNTLQSDRSHGTTNISPDLRKTFIHEGIHTVPAESVFLPQWNADPSQFNSDHAGPYNEASSIFYSAWEGG